MVEEFKWCNLTEYFESVSRSQSRRDRWEMSEVIQIDDGSLCSACKTTPVAEQVVQCFVCKTNFHAVCDAGGNENQLGSKTMVKTFGSGSTKSNFKFFCDTCLTLYERNLVDTENQKITALTEKVGKLETKLDEITKLLKSSDREMSSLPKPAVKTCWDDTEKLSQIKAPKPKPQLVIKKTTEQNQNKIEEALIQNQVQVAESFTNTVGDLVVVCETAEECETVRNLVSTTSEETEVRTPKETRSSITIVGFPKEYTKEEIVQLLVLQNGFVKGFANQNNIDEHIEIFSVRPLKNKEDCYQAFASVSHTLREGFKHFKNKITIGFANCRVYDRYHVKRCNICQHFGHYARECPTPVEYACGKCSGDHHTNDCDNEESKCVNCVRVGHEKCDHAAFDYKCPTLKKQQEVEKKKQLSKSLNYSLMNLSCQT